MKTLRLRSCVVVLLAAVLLLLVVRGASAATPTPISIAEPVPFGVVPPVDLFEDPTTKLTASEVIGREFRAVDRINHGYSWSAFWIRIAIRNPSVTEADTAILEFSATALHAQLFDIDGAEPRLLMRSGAELAFDARPVRHSNIAFRIALAPNETRTLLVRLEGRDTIIIDPLVWREATFWESVTRGRLLDGIYYGIIFGLAFFNLFLAFATREKAYLAYVAFQLSMAAFNLSVDKYSFQYLWPAHPVWAAHSEQAFNMLALAGAMLCGTQLLDTRTHVPRMNVALRVMFVVSLVPAIVMAFMDATPAIMFTLAAIALADVTLLVVAAALVARTGSPHGRIFLAAWSTLFLASILAALASLGFLQTFAGYSLLKVGSAVEATLLSFGLAARIRSIQRERAQAREELLTERSRRIDSLTRLVAGVAHEIGNPLNFAKGGADALGPMLDGIENPKRRASAKKAIGLVESGLDRIRRMLVHLRSDLGDRQALKTRVLIDEELDHAIEMLDLAKRGVEVKREGEKGLAVQARAGDLSQVFANLVRNAADAMQNNSPVPGGAVHISVARAGSDELEVTFRDEGPGVPEDVRTTLFEPFFTTRSREDGTGLGLYVSREIVARWGGTLTLAAASATEGRGATFVVRLPLDK